MQHSLPLNSLLSLWKEGRCELTVCISFARLCVYTFIYYVLLNWHLFLAVFISYLLTLVPDGMRGVRNILFEKAAAAVLTSCVSTHVHIQVYTTCLTVHMHNCRLYVCICITLVVCKYSQICTLDSQYIFLGSRLGNSLLLKYTTKGSRGQQIHYSTVCYSTEYQISDAN